MEKTPISREGLIEILAGLEHEQWVLWSKSLVAAGQVDVELSRQWKDFWCDYAALPNSAKELDREWARKVVKLLEGLNIVRW